MIELAKKLFGFIILFFVLCFYVMVLMFLSKLLFEGFGLKFNKEIKIEDYLVFCNLIITGLLSYLVYNLTKQTAKIDLDQRNETVTYREKQLALLIKYLADLANQIESGYDTVSTFCNKMNGFDSEPFKERIQFYVEHLLETCSKWDRYYNQIWDKPELLAIVSDDWERIEHLKHCISIVENRISKEYAKFGANGYTANDFVDFIVSYDNHVIGYNARAINPEDLNPLLKRYKQKEIQSIVRMTKRRMQRDEP